jgi:hypothetical protein
MRRLVLFGAVVTLLATSIPPSHAAGSWVWPVTGPVIREFDPPDSPYGSGHRGIDVAVPVGTGDVEEDDGQSGRGSEGGDTAPHGAGADDAELGDAHERGRVRVDPLGARVLTV